MSHRARPCRDRMRRRASSPRRTSRRLAARLVPVPRPAAVIGRGSQVGSQFIKGQKSQLSALTAGTDLYIGIQIVAPGMTWDVSCFGLDGSDRLSDDRFLIFYNQPASPEGSVQRLGP